MFDLSERSLRVLRKLVEHYIEDGQPVGSKKLAEDASIMVRSASIRNIMADLEAAGYLQSPHTSAGRVPTAQGYRLFVDNFIAVQTPVEEEIEKWRQQLGSDSNALGLVSNASTLLSNITRLAGIVTLPKENHAVLKRVEFLPLSQRRVLVILILDNQEVQNRVIATDRVYTTAELERAGNYLTQQFAGKDLLMAREELLHIMRNAREDLDRVLETIMTIAEEALVQEKKEDYVLTGEVNLLSCVNEMNYQKLRSLFEAFAQKRDILHLLDQAMSAKGMQIYIGEESGHAFFDDYSLVAAPYSKNGKVVGVLGVIGPTRMSYHKVIATVDITAKLLSQALEPV